MALINCPSCGKQISDKAIQCPHCGKIISLTYKPIRSKTWLIVSIVCLCIFVLSLMFLIDTLCLPSTDIVDFDLYTLFLVRVTVMTCSLLLAAIVSYLRAIYKKQSLIILFFLFITLSLYCICLHYSFIFYYLEYNSPFSFLCTI